MDPDPRAVIRDLMRACDRYIEAAAAHQAAACAVADQATAILRTLKMQRDCDLCGGFRYTGEAACTCPERCGWAYCCPRPDLGPRELWPPWCKGLSVLSAQATVAIIAALDAAAPLPLSTAQVETATGYNYRYGQLSYRQLARLARLGEIEKIEFEGLRSRYWRRLGGLSP